MTPIDPSDRLAVTLACNDGMQTAYEAGEKELPDLRYEGIYAVARAVLPEGYVAVPVELLRYLLECMPIGYIEESERERAYALLPEEATR